MLTDLRQAKLFLSAAMPGTQGNVGAVEAVEAALIAVSRAWLGNGGRIVMRGEPSLTSLVSLLAAEYYEPVRAEPDHSFEDDPVQRRWREHAVRPGPHLEIFEVEHDDSYLDEAGVSRYPEIEASGCVHFRWVSSGNSTSFVRNQIFEEHGDIRAMVAIGGDEGVTQDLASFRERFPNARAFLFASTYPLSDLTGVLPNGIETAEQLVGDERMEHFQRVRKEFLATWSGPTDDQAPAESQARIHLPYAFIANQIVRNLSG